MKKKLIFAALMLTAVFTKAQHVGSTPEYVKMLTSKWQGERFADGRPKVPDGIIERLKNCTLEQNTGYASIGDNICTWIRFEFAPNENY